MSEIVVFKKFTNECCRVYNYKYQLLGEIRKKRIGFYHEWCFHPNYVPKLGDVWFTQSFVQQLLDMMKTLKKRKYCHEHDMTDESQI